MKKTKIILIVVIHTYMFIFSGCKLLDSLLGIHNSNDADSKQTQSPGSRSIIYHISVGEGGKIYTATGRQPDVWELRESGTSRGLNYVDMFVTQDSTVSFTVGKSGTILHSTNSGINWTDISVSNNNFPDLYGFDFTDIPPGHITHIVAAGDSGKIVKTLYSGSNWTWQQFTVSPPRNLRTIITVTPSIWVAAGEQGSIYRTANSGTNWTYINSGVTNTLNRFARISFNTLLVVGDSGKILKSTNYGVSWSQRTSGTTKNLRDIYFKNSIEGIAVGDNGTARHTTDGGETWNSDPFLNGITTNDILSVSQVDSSTGISATRETTGFNIAAGTRFILVSSEPFIGISPISNLIPDFFSLKQNFPNPFNPNTKIRFTIPSDEKSNVKVEIFDIKGTKLDEIVNMKLKPGEYEIPWNGSNYPSGVYFYRISSNTATESRKMILVK